MPSFDKWGQKVPYPKLSDAPNIETALRDLVNASVAQVVLRFANANERAAALSGATPAVPGMLTYLIAEDRWEARRANGTWLLMSDGAWQSLTYSSGYVANAGSPGWRQKAGGGVELRGRIQRTGGTNFTADNAWRVFSTIPIAPGTPRYFVSAARHTVDANGQSHQTARIQVDVNGELSFGIELGGGTGVVGDPAWFSLDGLEFSPAGS